MRAENSDKTKLEALIQERQVLLKDAEQLAALKRVMLTEDGERIIKWLLKITKVLSNPFDNSGRTAFALGEQNIGRQLLFMLIDTGLPISITDLVDETNNDRLDNIYKKIGLLNKNIDKESKQC